MLPSAIKVYFSCKQVRHAALTINLRAAGAGYTTLSITMTGTGKYIVLNNGYKIPAIGLGTYKGDGLADVVKYSIDIGYRLIDTAFVYQNEVQIGQGISEKLQGNIKREDLFIVSKLWNTKHHPKDVIPSIKRSLADLKLEYLDLYLTHWPFANKAGKSEYEIFDLAEDDVPFEDTWKAMEECVKQGFTKSIGLSNFNSQQIERILKIAEIKPVVNQVECNPYFNQKKLIEFCKQKNLVVMAYSPFFAPNRPVPDNDFDLFGEPVIKELAAKYDKTVGQIILRYLSQIGTVPIPKSDNKDRLKQNLESLEFSLSDEDVAKMDSVNKNFRCTPHQAASKFKEYPFTIEY